ncbi:N-acetyllactosaminide beta-1,3-N-acetylglucosaminyltransferase 3-like isoform X2 [Siniperca chuatsi]|uniref:N-acetyllactosaminide beta-1,3-N-acetylglucosaminyltransferase 3-like isoform X2 n=1 Tax=Siniperca chuatsi TaxID=119488 RepID=UPI001CE1D4B8|nr:N-acetyllactosaminide beta-1,3-N-acetylglucosaminyltransferase 3-like isoform X2 [Siniperca chuatsi]
MRNIRAKTFLLAGALGLLVLHLCKDFIDHKTIHLPIDVREGHSQLQQHATKTSYTFSWTRCQQNMSAANITGFSSLPGGIKDFLYYRHCRHFPMLMDLPDKCGGPDKSAEVFLLLVIKSSPVNYERREVLRKTWAKERLHNGVWIRRIFISGTMGTGFEKERLNKLLELEQQEYSDILQWDFSDTFYNLTLKQILFLEWMERNCPNARFLLNGDDDVFANTDNMVEYLQSLKDNDGSKHLFTGHLIQNVGPIRSSGSKYFIPVQIQESESYPPYCGGGGFLLSGYTALVIYHMSQSIAILPIDDFYMGMCLAKAGLAPVSHMGFRTIESRSI